MAKAPDDWQIDVLFGLVESMSVTISALIAHQKDRDALEAHIDFRVRPARVGLLNASRTDLTLEGFDDLNAEFKRLINNEFEGWDDSGKVFAALRKRLAPGE